MAKAYDTWEPDQRITSAPHALSADLARKALVAEEAKIAGQVVDGSITRKKLSRSILTDLNRTVTKSMLGRGCARRPQPHRYRRYAFPLPSAKD
ncbi:MAG: hypothetical protein ACJZ72_00355 [Opitutales bacterium]